MTIDVLTCLWESVLSNFKILKVDRDAMTANNKIVRVNGLYGKDIIIG